jgi:WD40 repeat protein
MFDNTHNTRARKNQGDPERLLLLGNEIMTTGTIGRVVRVLAITILLSATCSPMRADELPSRPQPKPTTDKGEENPWDNLADRPDNLPLHAIYRLPLRNYVHVADVVSFGQSGDGRTLATASARTVFLWDTATHTERRRIIAHSATLTSVALSKDGKVVASADNEGTIVLSDAITGKKLQSFSAPKPADARAPRSVGALRFTPDADLLISRDTTGGVHAWNLATGKVVRSHDGGPCMGCTLALSPNGSMVAFGIGKKNAPGELLFCDPSTGNELRRIAASGEVGPLVFSPDGSQLACATRKDNKAVIVFVDPEKGAVKQTITTKALNATALAISPDGLTIIAGLTMVEVGDVRDEYRLGSWETQTGKQIPSAEFKNKAKDLQFSPEGGASVRPFRL